VDAAHALIVSQAATQPSAAQAPATQPAAPQPAATEAVAQAPTRARELDCLAQAVYFEARGESARGQQAVATVIMNRVKNPSFPKTVCGVVYQGANHHGCQFSFACDGHAERVVEWDAWEQARKIAARALSGVVLRDVGSATHFHTTGVDPEWGSRMLRVAQVGLHVFYRRNPHAAARTLDDDDDPPQFAGRAAEATSLRLAAAVVPPATTTAPQAKPVLPPLAGLDTKPVAKLAPVAPPAGLAHADAPVATKTEASAS
jgi:hypothetical protein